jgi:ABC-2 type transport system permease protein
MSRIIADITSYGKQYLRNKSAAFFLFAFPVLMILIFGAIFASSNMSKITVPVQNLDQGAYSLELLKTLNDTQVVKIKMISPDEDIAAYVKDNSLDMAILIPRNFTGQIESLMSSNGTDLAKVTLYGDPSKTTFGTIQGVLSQSLVHLNYNAAQARPLMTFDVKSVASDSYEYIDYFIPGVVGITVMTNSMYSMTQVCAEYRSRGFAKLLATTTLQKHEWLISKIAFYSIILTSSLVLTYVVGWLVFGLQATLTPLSFAFIAGGVFLFTSVGMLLGTVARDAEAGGAVANAIGFPMMFLSGAFFPLEMAPSWLQAISKVLPLTYFNDGLRDTMVFGNNASALVNLGVVLVVGVVLFVAASKLLSWKER